MSDRAYWSFRLELSKGLLLLQVSSVKGCLGSRYCRSGGDNLDNNVLKYPLSTLLSSFNLIVLIQLSYTNYINYTKFIWDGTVKLFIMVM